MAISPNDNRFFITLCNYLKKNDIVFEVTENAEIEYMNNTYNINIEQFGVVEHTKENLMACFDEIVSMFQVPYDKLYLHRFYFDVIDSVTNLGQYTLLFLLISQQETEEIEEVISEPEDFLIEEEIPKPEPEDLLIEEEIPEPEPAPVSYSYSSEEEILIDDAPEQEEEEVLEVIAHPEQDLSETIAEDQNEEFVIEEPIEEEIIEYEEIREEIQEEKDIEEEYMSEENIKKAEKASFMTQEMDENFYNLLQKDIDYLIKLLDKKINPEVSEVLSKAIMIVLKNRLEEE